MAVDLAAEYHEDTKITMGGNDERQARRP